MREFTWSSLITKRLGSRLLSSPEGESVGVAGTVGVNYFEKSGVVRVLGKLSSTAEVEEVASGSGGRSL